LLKPRYRHWPFRWCFCRQSHLMRTRDGLLRRIADGAEDGCTQSLRELAVSCREFRKRRPAAC